MLHFDFIVIHPNKILFAISARVPLVYSRDWRSRDFACEPILNEYERRGMNICRICESRDRLRSDV